MSELREKLIQKFKDKEYAHAYVDEFLNAYIATQIKVLRNQCKKTQAELAELADMKQTRISVLENINYDMWSISTLKKLAHAFDLTLNVSFETFSKRIGDIENFSGKFLERSPREEDLALQANKITPFQPANATNDKYEVRKNFSANRTDSSDNKLINADNDVFPVLSTDYRKTA
ncbi:MAG TPA: helix-turn-helix domain-containing protein [Flavobacteriaceae bacterium]|jgi:transcriptional regulator with XRE-family HTH domain